MKRLLLLLIATALLCAGCRNNFDRNMEAEAEEYTRKHCPERLDNFTTLDSMVYDRESHTLWQHLTVEEQAAELLKGHTAELKALLVENLKNDAKWKACKDKESNFGYIYTSHSGQRPICRIVLTAADYH